MTSITVTILTRNEEAIIGRCISSVSWADEILVLDSLSSDRTCEIAQTLGAVVHQQAWLGWVPQHQLAIDLARHDWVFVLDADEIVTPALAASIQSVMASDPDTKDGFSVDRRDELFGRLLPNMKRNRMRASFVRLFNRKESYYDPEILVHERVIYSGKAHLLKGILLHWRNVGFIEQQRKAAEYALLEADLLQRESVRPGAFRIILRPVFRFLWTYALRGGFRAGVPGLIYALMAAQGEFLRNATLWERQNVVSKIDPPASLCYPPGRHQQLQDRALAGRSKVDHGEAG